MVLLASCGGGTDAATTPEPAEVAPVDVAASDVPVVLPEGAPCSADLQCASGRCVVGLDVCAAAGCDCVAGWGCQDGFCVPGDWWQCAPCTLETDCDGGRHCVKLGLAGSFCLRTGCTGTCPGDSVCSEVEGAGKVCVPPSGACGCASWLDGRTTVCGNEACPGTRGCSGGALTACTARASAPESCNGVDDDCNGKTDDGPNVDASCDEGTACTVEHCDAGKCTYEPKPGACLIDLSCYAAGETAPGNHCVECNPNLYKTAWSPLPAACDDGVLCNGLETCDPAKGCVPGAPADGTPCDDGDACTKADECTAGGCQGKATPCDDGDQCTTDACTATGGCSHALEVAECDDGDPCTTDDTCTADACAGVPLDCSGLSTPCATGFCALGKCASEPVPCPPVLGVFAVPSAALRATPGDVHGLRGAFAPGGATGVSAGSGAHAVKWGFQSALP